jgi:structural maintenance of chromosome 2
MYVEELILEGFKTYMNRTVISAFDPQFNAITGLNGSGKSNILDGIQFLLGSTSKEMLRLKSGLTELIYKEGFAGIEKASVTIKFRCVDKQMRPTGYENCEELIVTRQITKDKVTKFFINGVSSNLTKVRNLFRSVQLNIENPHFLVKQGQITKIIQLKPLELLGMIEETAGTAYYNKTKIES